jgi:hypothetical protein
LGCKRDFHRGVSDIGIHRGVSEIGNRLHRSNIMPQRNIN